MSQVQMQTHYRSQDMMQELFEEINDYLVVQTKPIDSTASPISLPPTTSSIESEEEEEVEEVEEEIVENNYHDYQTNNNRINDEKSLYVEDEIPVDLQPAMYVESEDETSSQVDYVQYNDHHHDDQAICSCYKCDNNTHLGPPTQVSEDHNNNNNNNNNNNKGTKRLYRPKSASSFVSVSSAKLAHIAGLVKQTLGSTPHDLVPPLNKNKNNTNHNTNLNKQQDEIEYEIKFNESLVQQQQQQQSYLLHENKTFIDSYESDNTIDIDHNNNNTHFQHMNDEDTMINDFQHSFNNNHYWKANEINIDESNSYISKIYNNIDDNNYNMDDEQIDDDNDYNRDSHNDDSSIKENYNSQSSTAGTSGLDLINNFNEGSISKITNLPFLTPMHRIGEQHAIHLKTKSARDVGTHDDRINAYNNAYFHCVMAKTDMVLWIKKQYNKGPPILLQQHVPTPKKSSKSLFNLFKRHSKSNDNNNTLQPINTTFASENISRLSLSITATSPLVQSPTTLSPQPSIHTISSSFSCQQQQTNYETQDDQLYQAEFIQKNNNQLNNLSIDDNDNDDILLPQQLESLRPSPSVSMISTESRKENTLRKKNQKSQNNSSSLSNLNNDKNYNNNKLDTLSVNVLQPSLKKSPSISSLNSNNNQPVSILKKTASKHQVSTESQSPSSNNKREKYNMDDDYLPSLSPSPSSSSQQQQPRHHLRSRSVSPIPQSTLSRRSPSPSNLISSRHSSPSNERLDHHYHHQQQQRHMRISVSPSPRYLTTPDHHSTTRPKKLNNGGGGMAQPYRSNSNSSMRSNYSNSSGHNYADHHLGAPKIIHRSRSSEHLAPARLHNPMPKMLDPGNNNGMVRRRSSSNLIPPLNDGSVIRTRKLSNSSSHSNHQQHRYGNDYYRRWSSTPTSGRRSAEPRMNNSNNNRRTSMINNGNEDIYSYNYYDNIDDLDDLDGENDYYYHSSTPSGKQTSLYQKSPQGMRSNKWTTSQQQQQLQPMMKMEKPLRSRSPISRSQSKSSLNGHYQALDDLCSFFQHLPRNVLARYLQDAQGDFFLAKDLCMEDIMANGI